MKCRCPSDTHGHKAGKCQALAVTPNNLCQPCHDKVEQELATRKIAPMAQYIVVVALVIGLTIPAMAADHRGLYRGCRIVNIAPHYTQTTIRKGKRVYVTREVAKQDMAIICPPEASTTIYTRREIRRCARWYGGCASATTDVTPRRKPQKSGLPGRLKVHWVIGGFAAT